MKKVALITGVTGQDGSYLCKFLLNKNYKVIGADRRSSRNNNWRHNYLKIDNKIIIFMLILIIELISTYIMQIW